MLTDGDGVRVIKFTPTNHAQATEKRYTDFSVSEMNALNIAHQ